MFFRHQLVESGKTISNNGDTKIELDGNHIINGLLMHFACAGTSNLQADIKRTLIEHISKVVIMGDGDYELCSLTGDELAALWWYDQNQVPDMYQAFYGYKTNRVQLNLNFGRFFKDPEMGVDFSKWDDVDMTITMADFSTQYNSTGLTARIEKLVMEDLITPPSYWLRKVELESATPSAANQEVKYKVPKELTLRALLFLIDSDLNATTGVPTNYPNTDSNEFTLSFKGGSEKMYDKARPKDLFREMTARHGVVRTHGRMGLVTTNAIDTLIGYLESAIASAAEEGTGADTTVPSFAEENGRYILPKFAGTADHYGVQFMGAGFMSSWRAAFDHLGINEYLKTSEKSKVDVVWKPTTADHAFRMVKDQLVPNM
jgi:hypothetical protein